jgi:hypothetical protein
MSLQLMLTVHVLPLWFLVFALFLPRVTLLVFWLENGVAPLHLSGWLPVFVAVVLPRALVMYLIYQDQGISAWFVVHAIVALVVWGASGSATSRKSGR